MIITCPACDAQYLLPDESIASTGRRVKCTTCAHVWTQYPETEQAQPIIVEEEIESFDPVLTSFTDHLDEATEATYEEEPVITRQRITEPAPPVPKASVLKVVLNILVIALILIATTLIISLILRENLVKKWPASALLFETIGLPEDVPGKGLAIENIVSDTVTAEDNTVILSVKGRLVNTTSSLIFLPNLLVRVNGPAGLLKEWPIGLNNKALQAGKSVDFEYLLKDAPKDGQSITVVFNQ